jgi:LuxR family maltose regulon positive regulatory protein
LSPTTIRLPRSKLNPPVTGVSVIQRARLEEWFRRAVGASLVLLHAPAGFGKTTVMLQLLERFSGQGRATAWVTLDAADNDLGRFLAGLLAALQKIDPTLDPGAFDRDAFEAESALLNILDWAASYPSPFALFLDDAEAIQNPEVAAAIRALAQDLPPEGLLVLATREVPDLGLSRLRVRGRLLEIGPDDLRFASAESAEFLRRGCALAVDEEDAARLNHNVEGWAAALQLAALALAGRTDRKTFIDSFSGAFSDIADYLAEEVLSRQPGEVRDFLLKTSVLDRLSGPLCDALIGGTTSARLLSHLERANLFLVPLDEGRQWYRYHNVFRDFLRGRLEREQPGAFRRLHLSAAQWFADRGSTEEAAAHALAAEDLDRAAGLVAECAMALVRRGQVNMVHAWASRFPPETLARYPQLRIALCWALALRHRYAEANAVLDEIRRSFVQGVPVDSSTLDEVYSLEVFCLADRGEECLRLAQRNLLKIADRGSFACGVLLNVLGLRLLEAGQFDEAGRILRAGRESHRRTGSALGSTYVECILGALELTQGRLRAALARYRAAFQRVREALPAYSLPGALAAAFLAEALYEVDERAQAAELLDGFRERFPELVQLDAMLIGCITRARIRQTLGQPAKAAEVLARAERIGEERGAPRALATIQWERVRLALQRGDVAAAEREAQNLGEAGFENRPPGWTSPANDPETPEVGRLRLMVRTGGAGQALPRLRSELEAAEALHRRRRALKLRIVLAEALAAVGDKASALSVLRDAVLFGSREGYVRTFVDEGRTVLSLLAELRDAWGAEEAVEPDIAEHLERLLAAGRTSAPTLPAADAPAAWPFESLTDREVEILQLASAGCSNRALADRLFVTVATVKYHLRNINLKLHAENRTEAIAKARRVGLIP